MFWLRKLNKSKKEIKANKHAWHINYTTGDSKLEQIEK